MSKTISEGQKRDFFSAEGAVKENESFFSIAGLDPDASQEQAAKSYRNLMRETHPDKFQQRGEAAEKIAAARDVSSKISAAYGRYQNREMEFEKGETTAALEGTPQFLAIEDGKVSEGLEKAAEAVNNKIKIDVNRSNVFASVEDILGDEKKSDAEKLSDLDKFLKGNEAKATASRDTSFDIFSGAMSEVIAHDSTSKEQRLEFVGKMVENFSYLGEEVSDPKDKEAESQKIFIAYQKSAADEKFGQIVTNKFRGIFQEAADQALEPTEEEKKKLAEEKQKQNSTPNQDQSNEEEAEKAKEEKKSRLAEFVKSLDRADIAKGTLGFSSLIVLSVMFPGVGTLAGLAIMGALYYSSTGKESDKVENYESSPEQNSPANIQKATQNFVAQNSLEIEDEKEKLRELENKNPVPPVGKNSKDSEFDLEEIDEETKTDVDSVSVIESDNISLGSASKDDDFGVHPDDISSNDSETNSAIDENEFDDTRLENFTFSADDENKENIMPSELRKDLAGLMKDMKKTTSSSDTTSDPTLLATVDKATHQL